MRSDNLTRHMKQHTKRNESNPDTSISVADNYDTTSGVSTERKYEENEIKNEKSEINKKELRKQMPNNLGLDPFSAPFGHFGAPWWPFGFCRRCGVAGGERVPPSPLGWYFLYLSEEILFYII